MKFKKIKKNGLPLTHFYLLGMHCTIRGTRILSYSLLDWFRDKDMRKFFGRFPYVVSVPDSIIDNSFVSTDSLL